MSRKKSTTAKSLTTKRSTKKPRVTKLEVEYAETLPEFLKNARKVWNAEQPFMKRRGRPSFLKLVFDTLDRINAAEYSRRKPSQADLIRLLDQHLEESMPPVTTVHPYVKAWRLANIIGWDGIQEEDWEWLIQKRLDVEVMLMCEEREGPRKFPKDVHIWL